VADPRAVEWSRLHHGLDPRSVPLVGPWLRFVWWLARPLRTVPPTAVTAVGVLAAALAAWLAGPVPGAATALVMVAALCDALDGAVAVLARRASAAGARADAVADRICDALFAVALWRCGAPWPAAVAAGGSAVAVDALRRLRRVPAVVTVAERPTFTVCAALACLCAAVTPARWPVAVCAGVWLGAGCVGLAQVGRAPAAR